MNDKDMAKLTLGLEGGTNEVFIFRPSPKGNGKPIISRNVTKEFVQCMVGYANAKTNGGLKPMKVFTNGKHTHNIMISAVLDNAPSIQMPEE